MNIPLLIVWEISCSAEFDKNEKSYNLLINNLYVYIYIGLLYTKAKCSITKIVSDVSFLPIFVPVALAPPCLFRAHTHSFQYETLGLHHVEEQLANQVRRSGTDRFQTRPKPEIHSLLVTGEYNRSIIIIIE